MRVDATHGTDAFAGREYNKRVVTPDGIRLAVKRLPNESDRIHEVDERTDDVVGASDYVRLGEVRLRPHDSEELHVLGALSTPPIPVNETLVVLPLVGETIVGGADVHALL